MASTAEAVAAAKLWLVSAGGAGLPYLSEGLYSLVTVETDAVERVAADERWRLYVNPRWATDAPADELAREVAHHLWHLLLDHAGRARAARVDEAGAGPWGAAADLAVVDALAPEGVTPDWLDAAARRQRERTPALGRGRAAEEYFEALSRGTPPAALPDEGVGPEAGDAAPEADIHGAESTQGSGGAGEDGSASDGLHRPWELPAAVDVGGLEQADADAVRTAVALAYRDAAPGRPGETPGEVARWVLRLTEPRLPWEHLLAQAARRGVGWTSGRTHTTYTRPNRRAASAPGFVLPGWRRQNPAVACVVDTSGSVDEELLGRALGEVEGALRALGVGASDLTVLVCDASVQAIARVRRASDVALTGGGGTDLRVALAALERLRPRPTLAVVFTDGFTPWPDAPPPGCAVVVALLLPPGREAPGTPDWATTIECRPER